MFLLLFHQKSLFITILPSRCTYYSVGTELHQQIYNRKSDLEEGVGIFTIEVVTTRALPGRDRTKNYIYYRETNPS